MWSLFKSLNESWKKGTMIFPLLKKIKLRNTEVWKPGQGYTASKGQNMDLNPGLQIPELVLLSSLSSHLTPKPTRNRLKDDSPKLWQSFTCVAPLLPPSQH